MTERMKRGLSYEQQVRNYVAIQPDVLKAWLWSTTPERVFEEAGVIYDFEQQRIKRRKLYDVNENNMRDTGTDIFVQTTTGFKLVQAKNYSERKVYQDDLSGFFRHVIFYGFPGIVFSNSGFHWSLTDTPPGFNKICFQQFDYISPDSEVPSSNSTEKFLTLRDYQTQALATLESHFQTNMRAVLALSCGLGKTVVAAQAAQTFDNVVIFSPYQMHAEQNLRRFSDMLPAHNPRLVHCNSSRNVEVIKEDVSKYRKNIISSTFDSADVIAKLLHELGTSTLVIVDEFHNFTRAHIADSSTDFNRILTSDTKMLFLSATPRVFDLENTNLDEEDLSNFFGTCHISLPLSEAIRRKLVTDYRVFIPLFEETGDEDVCRRELGIVEIQEDLLSKAMFLVKCMLYEGARKTIVYLATQVQVDSFFFAPTQSGKRILRPWRVLGGRHNIRHLPVSKTRAAQTIHRLRRFRSFTEREDM